MVILISLTEMALTWYDVRHEKTFFLTVGVLGGAIWGASAKVVDVSRVDPHYFETADGRTFVPVGVNLVSGVQRGNEASLRRYEGWLEKFAANDGNNLWYHFARFAKAIEGLDPAAEHFRPFRTETARLRVYGLRGQKTTVIWCRDKKSTWETEVEKGVPPQTVQGERLPFANCTFACYLPWEDKAVSLPAPALPAFTRSIVVRFPTDPAYARIIEPH